MSPKLSQQTPPNQLVRTFGMQSSLLHQFSAYQSPGRRTAGSIYLTLLPAELLRSINQEFLYCIPLFLWIQEAMHHRLRLGRAYLVATQYFSLVWKASSGLEIGKLCKVSQGTDTPVSAISPVRGSFDGFQKWRRQSGLSHTARSLEFKPPLMLLIPLGTGPFLKGWRWYDALLTGPHRVVRVEC